MADDFATVGLCEAPQHACLEVHRSEEGVHAGIVWQAIQQLRKFLLRRFHAVSVPSEPRPESQLWFGIASSAMEMVG